MKLKNLPELMFFILFLPENLISAFFLDRLVYKCFIHDRCYIKVSHFLMPISFYI